MVQTDPRPQTTAEPAPRAHSGSAAAHPNGAIPQRPRLAPGVTLSGEMQDGAYEERRWLAQRDGQFVQLTELLYRTAEQIDGEHTLDEIAAALSTAIDRRVSTDNIRQLLETKLIPLGLVARADGSVVPQQSPDGSAASRSPLQINMRVRALSPHFINPFTALLQKLFWPPILLALLAVALAAQVYVFVIHGVASSVRDVLYHPALMFALLGLIIAGTVWHEFGHASALRYGGGQVRGMGVGIYLVYPAFYTDVTDNYRLSRWARVRTDLGGFYFNMIWCAATVGVYLLTHLSWLLLLVLLIDLEIIQQLLPFGRYDGYWTLADITGVPDFFSRIPDFVRALVPVMRPTNDDFAHYKRWVRIVFAIYILIAAPVMAFIFFMMIKNAPRVLATGWASARAQGTAFSVAHTHGDGLHMAISAAQLLILALPTFGMIYILFNLGRRGARALWRYSRPSAGRKVKAGLIVAGIAALLAYLWAPQLPFGGGRQGPWYSSASWTPIAPNERGTLGDAGNSLAQVPAPYNPFHRGSVRGLPAGPGTTARTSAGGRGSPPHATPNAAQASVTASARRGAGAGSRATPTPTAQTTATVTPTVPAAGTPATALPGQGTTPAGQATAQPGQGAVPAGQGSLPTATPPLAPTYLPTFTPTPVP